MPKTNWNMLIALLVFALAGCAPLQPGPVNFPVAPATRLPPVATATPLVVATQGTDTQTPAPLPTRGVETQMIPTNPALTPALQSMVDLARQDLAIRLSVAVNDITIIQAAGVTWSDSSLGCPEPGMAYAQMLSPGYLVVLGANGSHFEYHGGKNQKLTYCKNPLPPSSLSPEGD
jgi:hypothetical protein